MATKRTKGRGRSAVSGLTGGTGIVAGQKRKGSAGGPVDRTKRSKRITEQPKSTGKEPIEGTTRTKRVRARAKHRTELAAAPGNPGGLRPSERTPHFAKKSPPAPEYETSDYAKGKHREHKGEHTGHNYRRGVAKKKADAVRKRMAKKKGSY